MPSQPVRMVSWLHLGNERIATAGANTAALPAGVTIVVITAETAAVRYQVNGAGAATSMPVPMDQTRVIGPLADLASFGVYNAGGSVAYLEYYRETVS